MLVETYAIFISINLYTKITDKIIYNVIQKQVTRLSRTFFPFRRNMRSVKINIQRISEVRAVVKQRNFLVLNAYIL